MPEQKNVLQNATPLSTDDWCATRLFAQVVSWVFSPASNLALKGLSRSWGGAPRKLLYVSLSLVIKLVNKPLLIFSGVFLWHYFWVTSIAYVYIFTRGKTYSPTSRYIYSLRESPHKVRVWMTEFSIPLLTYCGCSLCGYLFWAILTILLVLVILDFNKMAVVRKQAFFFFFQKGSLLGCY